MQPFFFGTSQKPLFGVYHAAEPGPGRKQAVVLCQPLGHEYLRAHRAFRNLAVALAAQGAHVLRFDYLGSGDSAGDDEETTLEQCLADAATSIDELKDIAGVSKISLVGLRVGAMLAALTASRRSDIDHLVLWDPVFDGAAYLRELATLQQLWLQDRMGSRTVAAGDLELIGFPLTDAGRRQIAEAAIVPPLALSARSIHLMVSDDQPSYESFRHVLESAARPVDYHVVPGAGEWDRGDLVHQILLPHAMVRAIAAAMAA